MQCYASGTLFTGPWLAHTLNELHEHAKGCDRCQATILLAEHRAHHDRIHLRLHGLLCVTQATHPPTAHAQRGRAQHDTRGDDAALQRGRTDVRGRTHSATPHARSQDMGGYAEQPVVTTDADEYTMPPLCDQPGLLCCVVTCNNNVHGLWYYRADHHADRRCVCGCCVAKWPELCCNFSLSFDAYDRSRQPANTAAAAAPHDVSVTAAITQSHSITAARTAAMHIRR